jgi:DNA-binding CsgD family transcriptional regulator
VIDEEALTRGRTALTDGRWQEARAAFEGVLTETGSPGALAGLSDALFFLGEIRQSVQYRERAYAACRRAGNVPDAVESAVWLSLVYAMSLGNEVAAHGWLTRGESLLTDLDAAPLQAWLDYCRAVLDTETSRSRELLERAVAVARELGDVDLELCALAELGVVLVKDSDLSAGLRCVDEAMAGALGGDGTTHYTVVMTSCSMLTVCDLLGDLNRATKWSRAADEFTQAHGCPYLYAECRVVHGRVLMFTGHWQEAEEELERAALCTKETFPGVYNRTVASLSELRLRQGRLADAQSLIESIEAPLETSLVAAALALRRGQNLAAAALVERWLRNETDPVARPKHAGGKGLSVEMACALGLLVEARIAGGSIETATEAAERLDKLAAESGMGAAAAQAALAQGRIAAALERHPVAIGCFEGALACFGELELPFEAALVRLEIARAVVPAQPDLAVSEARAALAVLDRLGAAADADMAAALLRSWGANGRSVPPQAGVLTRREREILGLLAEGLSNQEVAERLYISRKTASHHVSNLLAKLGVRNRTEAAAYATRLRDKSIVSREDQSLR